MHLNVKWQFQLGCAAQALAQNFFFDFQLMLVPGVLVVAAAATGVVLATRLDAVCGGLDDGFTCGPCKSRLLLGDGRFNFLSSQDEGDEYGLAASAGFFRASIVSGRIGRQTGQAVASVDQLFDCEEQGLILRHDLGRDAAMQPEIPLSA